MMAIAIDDCWIGDVLCWRTGVCAEAEQNT